MPDISMCQDNACPSRLRCYRYNATPTPGRQTYGSFDRKPEAERCSFYWPTYPKMDEPAREAGKERGE